MLKYLIKKHFTLKKYKITLSYLDKFTTNQEINFILAQTNQINVIRVNKSTKKNYCHVDLTSSLDHNEIKVKLESFKLFGNKVKMRIKQLEEFDTTATENEEVIDAFSGAILKSNISNFFNTNFMNFIGCKEIIELLNNFDYDKRYQVIDCQRRFLEYEYKFVEIENKGLIEKKIMNSYHKSNIKLVPIKTFFKRTDIDSQEAIENFGEHSINIKNIINSVIHTINKLDLSIFDEKKYIGVWRNLQIKILNNQLMVNLMISQMQLDNFDFKYLKEILRAEIATIDKVKSVYLAINDKAKANTNNSSSYIHVGNKPFLLDSIGNLDINMLPNFTQLNEYLCKINIKEHFNIIDQFDNVIDYTSEFFPQCIIDLNLSPLL